MQLNICSVVCGCVCRGDWTDVGELGGECDGESEVGRIERVGLVN